MQHTPVLLQEVIDSLALQDGDVVCDGTLGPGGHGKEIIDRIGSLGLFIGIDKDKSALLSAQKNLKSRRAVFIEGNFKDMETLLNKRKIREVNKIVLDLGMGSHQLSGGRGFSFLEDAPLRMTFQKNAPVTAEVAVNEWSEKTLADIIFAFGEERHARKIARAICEERKRKRITRSRELAEIVERAFPRQSRKIHPATKTFQALRIAVNDELGALSKGLSSGWNMLSHSGRFAVISYHSLEDRIVKRFFQERARSGEGILIFKKPVTPQTDEIQNNPRARSAKLRVIEKI